MRKSINKKIWYLFVPIGIYILFHKPIAQILANTIVKHLFSQIDSVWYNDILFLSLTIGIITFTVKKYKNYTSSASISYILSTLSIGYIYYRFFSVTWTFTSFSFIAILKYADTLLIVTAANLILLIPKVKKSRTDIQGNFFDDAPISISKADEFGYGNYAKLVAEKIKLSSFDKSFAIGINGKWGVGKTSFINLMKNYLIDEDIINVEFNPWNSHTPQAIIKDFFNTMQDKISIYNSSISKLLIDYSNKLVALNDNKITQSIQVSISTITGLNSLNSLSESIDSSLKKINKKIIVYIDDLDRLDKSEIIEVIRLIRNTANFYNTFFIVAYDRNYVLNALHENNTYNHEEFLEKIFQLEITLPYFEKGKLRYKLIDNLKRTFPKEYHQVFETSIMGTVPLHKPYLDDWLKTMRDVTRLTNGICLNLKNLLGEVDINDFIKTELLRLKYPAVYNLLFTQTSEFLKANNQNDGVFKYQLASIKDTLGDIKDDKIKNVNENYLKYYLSENFHDLSVPSNKIDSICEFLADIFSNSISLGYNSRNKLSIIYPSKFNRYFAYTLLDGSLSEVDFSNSIKLNQEEFKTKITAWIKQGLMWELISRFGQVSSYDSKEDFEKIIKGIFYLANQSNNNLKYPGVIGYTDKDLYEKLNDYNDKLANSIYKEFNGRNGLRDFIKILFREAKLPFYFESDFIRYINSVYFDDKAFPLTKIELKSISVEYLKTYCNSIDKIDLYSFQLLWRCEQMNYDLQTSQSEKIIPIEAKEIFKDFILKHFNDFLYWMIEPEVFNPKILAVSKSVINIYDNWENFKLVLFEQDENKWNYLKEFKEFFLLFEKTNYSRYVAFNFEVIPVHLKLNK